MPSNHSTRTWGLALCATGVMFGASQATAAGPAEAQKAYERDRAACVSGQSHQDRATCLREAGAALAEARKGGLADGSSEFEKNKLARCDLQPAQDRPDCLRRMNGEGITKGSVEEGAVYRELTRTIDPAQEK